jgi:uncharacterized membrane protein YphA (DoxX/SURF4 family)
VSYLNAEHPLNVAMSVVGLAIVAAGVLLLIGVLTPIVSIAAAVASAVFAYYNQPVTQIVCVGFTLEIVKTLLVAAGLALAGPGAYSVDCYLFGRREIIIPDPPQPRSE